MTQSFANSGQTNLEPFMKQILSPRVGQPKDVAAAVAYLASYAAAYVTGTVLHVDGRLCAPQPYVADFDALMATGGSCAAATFPFVSCAFSASLSVHTIPAPSVASSPG